MTQKFTAMGAVLVCVNFVHPCSGGVQTIKTNGIESHHFS